MIRPQTADINGATALLLLGHFLWIAALLLNIGLDHLRRQPSRQSSVLAALEQHADNDVRIAP